MKRTKEILLRRLAKPRKRRWYRVNNKTRAQTRPCSCGCGSYTKGGFFISGHAAKMKGLWKRHLKEGIEIPTLAMEILEEFRLNPNRPLLMVVEDYWRKQQGMCKSCKFWRPADRVGNVRYGVCPILSDFIQADEDISTLQTIEFFGCKEWEQDNGNMEA